MVNDLFFSYLVGNPFLFRMDATVNQVTTKGGNQPQYSRNLPPHERSSSRYLAAASYRFEYVLTGGLSLNPTAPTPRIYGIRL